MSEPGALISPRHRLHPLTPLLRSANLVALTVAAVSWQGYQQLGPQRWILAVLGLMLVFLATSAVSWLVTGYQVVGRELRIQEGLLWRRHRAIRLDRLQSVELVRPVLARLTGLAELRLEVVGAAKTEAPLAYLRIEQAVMLRRRLLELAGIGLGQPQVVGTAHSRQGTPAIGHARRAATRNLQAVANADLILAQLLRPQAWLIPLAVAAPIVYFAVNFQLTFVGVASTITAVFGAAFAPLRALLADWNFTIATAPDGLRLRRGALETRNQVVPAGRVQAVGLHWPLLWRVKGWARAHIDVAGIAGGDREQVREGTLLPVTKPAVARNVISEVLPGFDLYAVAIHLVPRRAGWHAPLRRHVLGYALTPTAFVTRDGLLARQLVIVPYARIQSVRLVQGPWQRLLGLASVHADTAGHSLTAVATHRDAAEAQVLAQELAARSRAARAGGGGATPGSPATSPGDAQAPMA